jgi:hypothetical protein
MTALSMSKDRSSSSASPIGDFVAIAGGALILIAYLILPLRSDGAATGFGFIDASTTFPALTLVIGIAALVAGIVSITSLRETSVRWYFVGLGVLGMIFLLDNTLRGRAAFALGGWLAMIGCVLLFVQAVLPRPGYTSASRPQETAFALIRVTVATLWFTQLLWKLPWNNFGCPPGPLVPAANTSGLCDWIGREVVQPRWSVYKDFLTGFVTPNLSWMAFLIVGGEAFICFSLMLGGLTRLGGLAGFGMGINLFIGLTAIPIEWDWTYLMLPMVNVLFLIVGGRFYGIDGILYTRLTPAAEKGNTLARLLRSVVA